MGRLDVGGSAESEGKLGCSHYDDMMIIEVVLFLFKKRLE